MKILNNKVIEKTKSFFIGYMIVALSYTIILPFFTIFITSISTNTIAGVIPLNISFNRLLMIANRINYFTIFFNTLELSLITAIIQIFIISISAYAFTKLHFFGIKLIFLLMMFTIFVPLDALHLARSMHYNYNWFFGIKLLGSYRYIYIMTLFGMGIRSPIILYVFIQYFKRVPVSMIESAHLDGASTYRIYRNIMLPYSRGAIITCFILTFVWQWNDYYFVKVFADDASDTGTLLFSTIIVNRRYGNYNIIGLLSMFPLLILYMLVQKYFLDSIQKTIVIE